MRDAFPSRSEFAEQLMHHTMVMVHKRVVADLLTPVSAYARLAAAWPGASFLLESVEGGERWGRYSFIGVDPVAVVAARDGRLEIDGTPPLSPSADEGPLAYMRRLLDTCSSPPASGLPPFHGGVVGYIGYDCVREIERLAEPPPNDLGLPDMALMLARTLVVFDHFQQTASVIANVWRGAEVPTDKDVYERAVERCDEVVAVLSAPGDAGAFSLTVAEENPVDVTVDDSVYEGWVERARDHIFAGDIFQVVPSRRFSVAAPRSALSA